MQTILSYIKLYGQLMRLDKPIGTLLLLWPTLWALIIAGHGHPQLGIVLVFIAGVFLTRSAGCVFNDIADSKFDGHVQRTKFRPLASGMRSPFHALCLALILSMLAFILAIYFLQLNTLYLSIPALFLMISYPYTKRFLPIPQSYLGIAFSFGILMAFIELTGRINLTAVIIFIANFFWVLGYDTIYAMSDKEDDIHLDIHSAAITLGRYVVIFVATCYSIFIALLAYLYFLLSANIYYVLCLALAAMLLSYQVVILTVRKYDTKYIKLFKLNNWVGLLICLGIYLVYFKYGFITIF